MPLVHTFKERPSTSSMPGGMQRWQWKHCMTVEQRSLSIVLGRSPTIWVAWWRKISKTAALISKKHIYWREDLQALLSKDDGTGNTSPATAKDYHRVTTFFASLDKVLTEMKTRFNDQDRDILFSLGDVVLGSSPAEYSSKQISSCYGLDYDFLVSEK